MAKLTDSQLIILSAAAARDDGTAVVPAKMNKTAASKVGSSLVARKLMREVKAKRGAPVWREDEDGRPISLIITRAGREAIGVEDGLDTRKEGVSSRKKQKKEACEGRAPVRKEATASAVLSPRAGSKQALIIAMLSAKAGTTIAALVEATGWLPHTTRAALTGLRKRGVAVERSRVDGEASVYRLAAGSSPAAAV